jgi:hypothetical protein
MDVRSCARSLDQSAFAEVRPPQLAASFHSTPTVCVQNSNVPLWIDRACRENADGKQRVLIRKCITHSRNNTVMRVAMATVVALLILNFADEHFNSARYTRGAMAMLSHIARSFS